MSSFIHTFSMTTKITIDDLCSLKDAYDELFWNGDTKKYVLGKYAEQGLRIEIDNCKEKEIQFDRKYVKKVKMIFTLYKLVYPGMKMGAITEQKDIILAVKNVCNLLQEIYRVSKVDLMRDVKIKRIDVTCDIETPSEEYSKEIIRISKKLHLPYGYHFWIPTQEQVEENDWSLENSILFYNHSQDIQVKIYNKKQDAEVKDILEEKIGEKGLIRLELSLKRNFLKEKLYIRKDNADNIVAQLIEVLWEVTRDSSNLLGEYVSDVLYSGEMLSKKIQKSYIERKYGGKDACIKKMLKYIKLVNSDKSNAKESYGSSKSIRSIEQKFADINLSPIYTRKECPYIPSLKNVCKGEVDGKVLRYAKTKMIEKSVVYWDIV